MLDIYEVDTDEIYLDELDDIDLPFAQPQPVIYEDWKAFVDRPQPVKPETPTAAEFAKMSEREKHESRKNRMLYHAAFGPLKIDSHMKISGDLLLLSNNNLRASPGARVGGVIDGEGTLGKTTIVLQIGRKYEKARRKQMRDRLGEDDLMPNGWAFIPVVYIVLPGETTPKSLYEALADYYGVPLPARYTLSWLKKKVREFARNCGTSLIIVDEVHYLQMRNRNDEDVNNHLKELANIVSATLVYAGIDCDGANLFNEGRSEDTKRFSQTRRRFKEYKVTAYTLKNETRKNRWLSLINSFEAHMCLVKHEPGSLVGLGEYIFYRTGGSVGAVSTLVRQGANLAIKEGGEKFTKTLLNKVRLDKGSEEYHKEYLARQRERKKASS